ncbi:uncharacterized protein LOC136031412 isoform X3 [Artemia franciscana]|uniref:uncharacterized protein LOC136031412 isoform X3 n=1 Tax=Artemia franciscana TaxID=6661 RepID=UPI0032DADD62
MGTKLVGLPSMAKVNLKIVLKDGIENDGPCSKTLRKSEREASRVAVNKIRNTFLFEKLNTKLRRPDDSYELRNVAELFRLEAETQTRKGCIEVERTCLRNEKEDKLESNVPPRQRTKKVHFQIEASHRIVENIAFSEVSVAGIEGSSTQQKGAEAGKAFECTSPKSIRSRKIQKKETCDISMLKTKPSRTDGATVKASDVNKKALSLKNDTSKADDSKIKEAQVMSDIVEEQPKALRIRTRQKKQEPIISEGFKKTRKTRQERTIISEVRAVAATRTKARARASPSPQNPVLDKCAIACPVITRQMTAGSLVTAVEMLPVMPKTTVFPVIPPRLPVSPKGCTASVEPLLKVSKTAKAPGQAMDATLAAIEIPIARLETEPRVAADICWILSTLKALQDTPSENEIASACALRMIKEMSKEDTMCIGDAVVEDLLQIFRSPMQLGPPDVQKNAMMAVASLAEVLGDDFVKYMEAFSPFLCTGIKNVDKSGVCQAAIGTVKNICRAMGSRVHPYCKDIMSALTESLNNASSTSLLKPEIMVVFGDVAWAIKTEFQIYLEVVLTLIRAQLGFIYKEATRHKSDNIECLVRLRDCCSQTYEFIFKCLREEMGTQMFLSLLADFPTIVEPLTKIAEDINRILAATQYIGKPK